MIPADIAFDEIATAEGPIDDAVDEFGAGVGRKRGIEFLIATDELDVEGFGKIFGEGDGFVLAAAEIAVEFGVVSVEEKPGAPDVGKGDAVGLIQGVLRVGAGFAAAESGVEADVLGKIEAHVATEALERDIGRRGRYR